MLRISVFLLLLLPAFVANAGKTVVNPMIWADVPDPDVIRVGDTYYMVSTTMHLMPGAPIMRSTDLAEWETAGYIFDRLTDSPKYDMNGGTVYGRGQWATSLKYHNGKFYALFAPNDHPGGDTYIYSAVDAAGPWTLVSRMRHFHDASLFFDEDGRVYVFYGTGELVELNADLSGVKAGGVDMRIFEREADETGLLEGSRVVKHDGRYYLLMISWPQGGKRRQVCYRADRITGPYEKKEILKSDFGGFPYVGQGTIVDGADGRWHAIIFQDRGGVGRVLTLMPCRWESGWPILGDDSGRVPLETAAATAASAPEAAPLVPLTTGDDFDAPRLHIDWQWNHNPVDEAWSLTERPGYLRLKTNRVAKNLYEALNTITQRMEGPRCSGTVAIDVSNMRDGDRCGLAAFNGHSGLLTISCEGSKRFLTMSEALVHLTDREKAVTHVDEEAKERVPLSSSLVYLRLDADFRVGADTAEFYYSTDGHQWQRIGSTFKMRFDYRRLFMGTRFAIFNYATEKSGGYVDIDKFVYKHIGITDVTDVTD